MVQKRGVSRTRKTAVPLLKMRVGIVGAGISGVVAGAHLKKANINITVFERSKAPGGVWYQIQGQLI